jgi:hypothetical protein
MNCDESQAVGGIETQKAGLVAVPSIASVFGGHFVSQVNEFVVSWTFKYVPVGHTEPEEGTQIPDKNPSCGEGVKSVGHVFVHVRF